MNESYNYDHWGNITAKTNVGHYQYDATKTNRLTGVCQNSGFSGTKYYSMGYDSNGNVTSDGKRTFTYTPFDKPARVTQGSHTTDFSYGSDRQLYRRVDVRDGKTTESLYIDGVYERTTLPSGVQEHKFYVGHAVITKRSNHAHDELYLHKDNQGSTISITNATGSVLQQFIYDPWGKQYSVATNSLFTTYSNPGTSKGYTGHNMVNDFDVIHMGGRTYNPVLGRFMQADPFIQAPSNLQNYNRYSYVMNNPMSYNDPSGYFVKKLFKSVAKIPILNAAVTIALAVYCQACLVAYNTLSTYAITGSLRSGLIAGFTTAIMPGGGSAGRILASAAIGGISTKMQGGKFGHGFASAGLGAGLGGRITLGNSVANVITSGIIGGTISKLTGGKFVNGAQTWAFQTAITQDWSSTRGQFNNNTDVEAGYQKSLDTYGSQDVSAKLSEDAYLNYTVSGSEGFADDVASYISELNKTSTGHEMLTSLAKSSTGLAIFENIGQSAATARGFFDFSWEKTIIALDPRAVKAPAGLFQTVGGEAVRPYIPAQHSLGHELVHAWQNTSWSNGAPKISHSISGSSP